MPVLFNAYGGLTDIGSRNSYGIIDTNAGCVYLLDCGRSSQGDTEYRKSALTPDFSALLKDGLSVEAVFVSHGHRDHIGGWNAFELEYARRHTKQFRSPVYASEYTGKVALLSNTSDRVQQHLVPVREEGISRTTAHFDFFPVIHSIPGSLGCRLEVNGKVIVYLGDIKLSGTKQETAQLKNTLGDLDCDVLLLDATGANKPGKTRPDHLISRTIVETITNTRGKVVVPMSASNIDRARRVIYETRRRFAHREVLVAGLALRSHLELADVRGWDIYREDLPVSKDAVVLVTGSRAEENSVLEAVCSGSMPGLELSDGDALVFPVSSVITEDTQNTERVQSMIQRVGATGCTVHIPDHSGWKEETFPGVAIETGAYHCSGHAAREDLQEIVRLVEPKTVIPVHADEATRLEAIRLLNSEVHTVLAHESEYVHL